jgi:hypothetical protein
VPRAVFLRCMVACAKAPASDPKMRDATQAVLGPESQRVVRELLTVYVKMLEVNGSCSCRRSLCCPFVHCRAWLCCLRGHLPCPCHARCCKLEAVATMAS